MASYSGRYPTRPHSTTVRDKTSRNAERVETDPLLPGYSTWGSSDGPATGECCKCGYYSFLKTVSVAGTIVAIFTLFLLPGIIAAWRAPYNPAPLKPLPDSPNKEPPPPHKEPWHPPPPPSEPYQLAGLGGSDVPLPGSTYIITEANSSKALTYNGNEGVAMDEYHHHLRNQQWSCHEAEGWLGFAVDPGHSTVFLGYGAWPSPPTLRSGARVQQFNEMFVISKLPEHGYRMIMRDGGGLKPVGRDSDGRLAMVGVSDVWWRFTKV
ncbi:hypothetical protein TWF281_005279 [Arthrobotrys megalospora]